MSKYSCICGKEFDKQTAYAGHRSRCVFNKDLSEEEYLELEREERHNLLFEVIKEKVDEGEIGLATGEIIEAVSNGEWASNGDAYSQLYSDMQFSDDIWSEKITIDYKSRKQKKKWFASELDQKYEKLRLIRRWLVELSKDSDLEGKLKGKFDNLAYITESIMDFMIEEEKNWKIHPEKLRD